MLLWYFPSNLKWLFIVYIDYTLCTMIINFFIKRPILYVDDGNINADHTHWHVDGFVQDRCNSSANALELHLSCTNWCVPHTLLFCCAWVLYYSPASCDNVNYGSVVVLSWLVIKEAHQRDNYGRYVPKQWWRHMKTLVSDTSTYGMHK